MEIKIINNSNYLKLFTDVLTNKKETILYGVADDYVVLKGDNQINEEYCKTHNLDVYPSSNMGGCIILSAGDVEFNIFRYGGWKDVEKYTQIFFNFLKSKIPNLSLDNNDFMVDGKYKVASCSSRHMGEDFIYTGFHFSVNVDMEHIKNICLKPMVKIPKGLSDYGITSEEIVEFLRKQLEKTIIEEK